MIKDLTVGSPTKVLAKFCLPLFGSVVFQQLYNIADSFVAGKFVGEEALAAVGNSYEITLLFIAFAFGSNIGCSVIVSRLFGAKKYGDMKTSVYTAFISFGVLCLVLMAVGILFDGTLLAAIDTPDSIFNESKLYLDIYIWGLPFVFFYNVSSGIFSALGDSKTPFIFLMCSSLANIGMDILFTTALLPMFSHGVAAVAWATFICQGVSAVLAIIIVFARLRSVKTDDKVRAFSLPIFGDIASVAIPSILQQSFISVGNIFIQKIINTFGTGIMAGYSASVKLNNLVMTSFVTLGNGISNFTSQNLGAHNTDRVRKGFKAGVKIIVSVAIPFTLLYFIGSEVLINLFLDEPSEEAIRSGTMFLRIVTPFYFLPAIKLASDGVLRGAKLMKPFMIATFADLILRVLISLLLSETSLGINGVWISWPVGWIVGALLSYLFYRKYVEKNNNTAL